MPETRMIAWDSGILGPLPLLYAFLLLRNAFVSGGATFPAFCALST